MPVGSAISAKVTIYTTGYCAYCSAAKRLLEQKGAPFEEIRCDDRDDLREWLISASGQRTVPQIFINGQSVGGYSELAALQKAGRLDPLLATAPAPDGAALPG